MTMYSIHDYIEMYFKDLMICNKEEYEKYFENGKENRGLLYGSQKNLLKELEKKCVQIATCIPRIFEMNSYDIYYKGLAVIVYSFEYLNEAFKFDALQVQFVKKWVSKTL